MANKTYYVTISLLLLTCGLLISALYFDQTLKAGCPKFFEGLWCNISSTDGNLSIFNVWKVYRNQTVKCFTDYCRDTLGALIKCSDVNSTFCKIKIKVNECQDNCVNESRENLAAIFWLCGGASAYCFIISLIFSCIACAGCQKDDNEESKLESQSLLSTTTDSSKKKVRFAPYIMPTTRAYEPFEV